MSLRDLGAIAALTLAWIAVFLRATRPPGTDQAPARTPIPPSTARAPRTPPLRGRAAGKAEARVLAGRGSTAPGCPKHPGRP